MKHTKIHAYWFRRFEDIVRYSGLTFMAHPVYEDITEWLSLCLLTVF